MTSAVTKHSIFIDGRKTSVALEPAFYHHLKRIARERGMKVGDLAAEVAGPTRPTNLSSCLRLLVLADLEAAAGIAPAISAPIDRAIAAGLSQEAS